MKYPINKTISAYLDSLNDAAIRAQQYWPVARLGKNTKKILGKYETANEAKTRARRYRGRGDTVYICGYLVNNHNRIPRM